MMDSMLTFSLVVFCGLLLMLVNRKLLARKRQYTLAFGHIHDQLKCRHDIIPNLIDASKMYLRYDQEALAAVSSARLRAQAVLSAASANLDENSVSSLAAVETELNEALFNLQSVIQTYPELKKDKLILDLTDVLESVENRVTCARQTYNHFACSYNAARQTFPANILAGLLGHNRDAALLTFEDHNAVHMSSRILL